MGWEHGSVAMLPSFKRIPPSWMFIWEAKSFHGASLLMLIFPIVSLLIFYSFVLYAFYSYVLYVHWFSLLSLLPSLSRQRLWKQPMKCSYTVISMKQVNGHEHP